MARLTEKTFKEALKNTGGNQTSIANALKKDPSTISKFLLKHPKMRELRNLEAERIIDVSENVVDHDIVTNRNVDTAKWKLINSKRGKSRGYGPKIEQEMSGSFDNKIEVEIIEVTKSEDEDSDDTGV